MVGRHQGSDTSYTSVCVSLFSAAALGSLLFVLDDKLATSTKSERRSAASGRKSVSLSQLSIKTRQREKRLISVCDLSKCACPHLKKLSKVKPRLIQYSVWLHRNLMSRLVQQEVAT